MDEGSVDGRRNQLISHVVPKSRSCGVLSFMTTAGPPKDGGAREGKTCTKIRAGRATTSRRPLRGAETQHAAPRSVAACVHLLCHSPCLIYNNGRGSSNLPHPSRRHPSAPRGGLPLPARPPSLPSSSSSALGNTTNEDITLSRPNSQRAHSTTGCAPSLRRRAGRRPGRLTCSPTSVPPSLRPLVAFWTWPPPSRRARVSPSFEIWLARCSTAAVTATTTTTTLYPSTQKRV